MTDKNLSNLLIEEDEEKKKQAEAFKALEDSSPLGQLKQASESTDFESLSDVADKYSESETDTDTTVTEEEPDAFQQAKENASDITEDNQQLIDNAPDTSEEAALKEEAEGYIQAGEEAEVDNIIKEYFTQNPEAQREFISAMKTKKDPENRLTMTEFVAAEALAQGKPVEIINNDDGTYDVKVLEKEEEVNAAEAGVYKLVSFGSTLYGNPASYNLNDNIITPMEASRTGLYNTTRKLFGYGVGGNIANTAVDLINIVKEAPMRVVGALGNLSMDIYDVITQTQTKASMTAYETDIIDGQPVNNYAGEFRRLFNMYRLKDASESGLYNLACSMADIAVLNTFVKGLTGAAAVLKVTPEVTEAVTAATEAGTVAPEGIAKVGYLQSVVKWLKNSPKAQEIVKDAVVDAIVTPNDYKDQFETNMALNSDSEFVNYVTSSEPDNPWLVRASNVAEGVVLNALLMGGGKMLKGIKNSAKEAVEETTEKVVDTVLTPETEDQISKAATKARKSIVDYLYHGQTFDPVERHLQKMRRSIKQATGDDYQAIVNTKHLYGFFKKRADELGEDVLDVMNRYDIHFVMDKKPTVVQTVVDGVPRDNHIYGSIGLPRLHNKKGPLVITIHLSPEYKSETITHELVHLELWDKIDRGLKGQLDKDAWHDLIKKYGVNPTTGEIANVDAERFVDDILNILRPEMNISDEAQAIVHERDLLKESIIEDLHDIIKNMGDEDLAADPTFKNAINRAYGKIIVDKYGLTGEVADDIQILYDSDFDVKDLLDDIKASKNAEYLATLESGKGQKGYRYNPLNPKQLKDNKRAKSAARLMGLGFANDGDIHMVKHTLVDIDEKAVEKGMMLTLTGKLTKNTDASIIRNFEEELVDIASTIRAYQYGSANVAVNIMNDLKILSGFRHRADGSIVKGQQAAYAAQICKIYNNLVKGQNFAEHIIEGKRGFGLGLRSFAAPLDIDTFRHNVTRAIKKGVLKDLDNVDVDNICRFLSSDFGTDELTTVFNKSLKFFAEKLNTNVDDIFEGLQISDDFIDAISKSTPEEAAKLLESLGDNDITTLIHRAYILKENAKAVFSYIDIERVAKNAAEAATPKEAADIVESAVKAGKEAAAEAAKPKGFMYKLKVTTRAATNWYINAILSGPASHVRNMVSNVQTLLGTDTAAVIGSLYDGANLRIKKAINVGNVTDELIQQQDAVTKQAIGNICGIGKSFTDLWALINTAIKTGDCALITPERAKQTEALKSIIDPNAAKPSWVGDLLHALDSKINFTTKLLTAEDSVFEVLAARSYIYGESVKQGLEQGLKGDELKKYIADHMQHAIKKFVEEGDTFLRTDSLNASIFAEAQTLKSSVKGTLAETILDAKKKHETLAILIPFIKAPYNEARMIKSYIPGIGLMNKAVQETLAKETPDIAKSTIHGKQILGSFIMMTGMMFFNSGRLTGSMSNKRSNVKSLDDVGVMPYSIKIGDNWYSYSNLGPITGLLELTADICEVVSAAVHNCDEENINDPNTIKVLDGVQDVIFAGSMAMVNFLTNRTYFAQLGEIMEIMTDPSVESAQKKASMLTGKIASGFIPRIATATNRAFIDPEMHQVSDMVGRLKNNIPGLSSTLPVQHSWLTGETRQYTSYSNFLPFRAGRNNSGVSQKTQTELLKYKDLLDPPSKRLNDIVLDDAQYSRFCELNGTVKLAKFDNRTLIEQLEKFTNSPQYDRLTSEEAKVAAYRRILRLYREEAKRQFVKELDLAGVESHKVRDEEEINDLMALKEAGYYF